MFLLAAWGLGVCMPATAQPAEEPPEPTLPYPYEPPPPAPSLAETAEAARETVRSTARWLARTVDGWFGQSHPFAPTPEVTSGRVSMRLVQREHEKPDLNVRFNARFQLPNLERWGYLFLGRDNRRELVNDRPSTFSREQRLLRENSEDRSFFGGLGLWSDEALDFRLGFRGGLKPYAQARYRQPWHLGEADWIDFRETVFWSADDRFGSTTVITYEHTFSPTLVGRWINAATITQRSRDFEWSSAVGAYWTVGYLRLLSLEALCNGVHNSGMGVSDYGLQARWEQPIHENWLIGELLIGHFWPRTDALTPRGRSWAVGAGIKMDF